MKKKFFYIFVAGTLFFVTNLYNETNAVPNPWINCQYDISCAAKKAGFNFPLRVKDYSVRAMKDMIEITYPFDKKRTVTVRKTTAYGGDTSGVYKNYPVNKTITLKDSIMFNVRGDKKKYYVVNFSAETGYYSIYCEKGLSIGDINSLYELIAEAEAPVYNPDEKSNYTIEQLQDKRRTGDVVKTVFSQDCFPRTLQKKGVTKNCFERANLGDNSACSASEIKMIKEYYRKEYKCDPLNDGTKRFCAKE